MSLERAGAALSAVYHRWLVGAATDAEFAQAGDAYVAASKARHGEGWQRLEQGAFMAPMGAR